MEIHHRPVGNLVENLPNHAAGVVGHPLVDVSEGLVVKFGAENVRAVIIGIGLQKCLLEVERILSEPDGIRRGEPRLFIGRQTVEIRA